MTALITGATSGIGFEFAKLLAKNNHDLILVARNRSKLDRIKVDFHQAYHVKVYVIECDLCQEGACGDVYAQIRKKNLDVDILINNAGIGDWGLFVDSNLTKQEEILQLNVRAVTQLTRLFTPLMVMRGQGRVLNVASTAAFQPGPLMSVYFASKAYVLSFSCAVAEELKGSGVTVTCLCPGPTATDFQSSTFRQDIRLMHGGHKLPKPEEIAWHGYRAMLKGKLIAVPGFLNKLMVLSVRFLPMKVILRLVHFMQSAKEEEK